MRTVIVTGTDTDIGKTVFAAGLAAVTGSRYWKPVQSGLEDGSDSARVADLGVPQSHILQEAYRLTTPCSPHLAAEIDDVTIDRAKLALPDIDGPLVVEGAGGALVPVTRNLLFANLFAQWQQPVIIVARTMLGTINHSLLTIEALRARDVPILGIAFVGDAQEDSERTITDFGRVKRLGRLPIIEPLNAHSLADAFRASFDLTDFES